jgi:hypothetical protein
MINHVCSVLKMNMYLIFSLSPVWLNISGELFHLKIVNIDIGVNFELVARYWIRNKKHSMLNMFSETVLWSI